ncbi:MAG: type II toxin-antitoxin system RelE/ParE family toxin [Armatimonadetes bacterium]|nr:type II toxin-antitoxin system RelE/ParE family toxin [Armatimonadota bacterium]
MTYALRFLPEVEEDAIAGYSWYEQKSDGLGEEFLRMFYACANETARTPRQYPEVYHDFRRRLLRRFPYALYYRIAGEEVIVFGLFHCARDPDGIASSLLDRQES